MVPGEPPGESSSGELGILVGGVAIVDIPQFYSRGMSRSFNSTRAVFYCSGRQWKYLSVVGKPLVDKRQISGKPGTYKIGSCHPNEGKLEGGVVESG